jgi:transposase
MSLQPVCIYIVPEQTARVARAAFPKGSLCMRLYNQLGTIFQDQDFADLFPESGQQGQSPFRLALITILQSLEGFSDRNAADAVRGRIDWRYLLCLELETLALTTRYCASFGLDYLKADWNVLQIGLPGLIVKRREPLPSLA